MIHIACTGHGDGFKPICGSPETEVIRCATTKDITHVVNRFRDRICDSCINLATLALLKVAEDFWKIGVGPPPYLDNFVKDLLDRREIYE